MVTPEIIRWSFPLPETHVAVTCLTVQMPCNPRLPIQLPPVVRLPLRPKRES